MGDSAIHALAGSVGGCVSMALTYPLVNLSTRAAVKQKSAAKKEEELSIVSALQKTLKEEGLAGLYSGLDSSLFGIAVTNGVYYAFYEEMRSLLLRRRGTTSSSPHALTTREGILAGLVAGSITTLSTNPIWTVQTAQSTKAVVRPSSQGSEGSGGDVKHGAKVKLSALDAAREIYKSDGLKGFWRGIGPALVLVINPVIQYTTYERLVGVLLAWRLARKGTQPTGKVGRSSLTDWDLFMLGAVSKLVATGGTYPYIVVKSRLQAATHKYTSSLKAVLHILHTEGAAGLYAGLLPKLLQSVLTAAFMFVAQRRIYELVKKMVMLAAEKKGLAARA